MKRKNCRKYTNTSPIHNRRGKQNLSTFIRHTTVESPKIISITLKTKKFTTSKKLFRISNNEPVCQRIFHEQDYYRKNLSERCRYNSEDNLSLSYVIPQINTNENDSGVIIGGVTTKISNLKHVDKIEILKLANNIVFEVNKMLIGSIGLHDIINVVICCVDIAKKTKITLKKEEMIVLYTLIDTYNTNLQSHISFEDAFRRANNYCITHGEQTFTEDSFSDIVNRLYIFGCINITDKGLYLDEKIV